MSINIFSPRETKSKTMMADLILWKKIGLPKIFFLKMHKLSISISRLRSSRAEEPRGIVTYEYFKGKYFIYARKL